MGSTATLRVFPGFAEHNLAGIPLTFHLPAVPFDVNLPGIPLAVNLPAVPLPFDLPAIDMSSRASGLPGIPMTFDLPAIPLETPLPAIPMTVNLPTIPLIESVDLPAIPMTFDLPTIEFGKVTIGEVVLGWTEEVGLPTTIGEVAISDTPVITPGEEPPPVSRWEIRPWGFTRWTDISDHIAGEAVMTEGADTGSLTGLIRPRASVMMLGISDADGFFDTPGTHNLVEPGAQLRYSWANPGSELTQRFIGWLTAVRRTDDDVLMTEWAGQMWRITCSASGKEPRLFREMTLPQMFQSLAEDSGIPGFAVSSDPDTALYNVLVPGGVDGLCDLAEIGQAVLYDQPLGALHMELPPTRARKTATLRWSDMTPRADEYPIPRARDLRQAFGVINYAAAELRIYAPSNASPESRAYDIPDTEILIPPNERSSATINFDADALISPQAVYIMALTLSYSGLSTTVASIGTPVSAVLRGVVPAGRPDAGDIVNVSVANIRATGNGSTITIAFDFIGSITTPDAGVVAEHITLSGSVSVVNTYSLDLGSPTRVVERHADERSIARYGRRPRPRPLVVTRIQDTPLPDDFEASPIDIAYLRALAAAEVELFASPVPVYSVLHSGQRTIRGRRISDLEHLRLRDGTDADFFVEALETRISAVGGLLQTVYYVEASRRRPRRVPLPPA